MSLRDVHEPECHEHHAPAIDVLVEGRPRDLGGFTVRRLLPSIRRRAVGPFVFLDHMGPATFPAGEGINVRPHPHINLATLTYLFEGEIFHRDSLGSAALIKPGEVNWMSAGKGIVHSERTRPETRSVVSHLHGLQLWAALPKQHEESEPAFMHLDADELPVATGEGWSLRVVAGEALGVQSGLQSRAPVFFAELQLEAEASCPAIEGIDELAVYPIEGTVQVKGEPEGCRVEANHLGVLAQGVSPQLEALGGPVKAALIGGAPLDGPRHMWWNFVSSRKERIEQAKADWKGGAFGKVPGDDDEFIPLPER